MNAPVLLQVLANFACIGLLTLFFFKRDFSTTLRWWLTAVPHVACPLLLITAYFTGVAPLTPASWATPLALAAVVPSVASVALMFFAWGTHRTPLAHFHQRDDAPVRIVTHGAYRRIRHPFYSSYLLVYLAAVLLFPHVVTLALFGYVVLMFNVTAAGEERRLAGSRFGAEYRAYLTHTRRFLPRLGPR
ncbi:methyltransferase family protein [Amycolatopsis solani]|uniref:methyltransferase family protein n=1 Tax=Amycolatopsis solani TaxID=3028615 RepID=UPI0025B119C0|nr:isoprenylcysteine carboxylmethyltransferase family protein [Amycolatopsis sp. MEP2-6]